MGTSSTVRRRITPSPVLRPGLRVFRRDDDQLQVGIDDPRVLLPDGEGVRRLLTELEKGGDLASLTPEAGLAFARLVEAGLVVERADLASAARTYRRAATTAVFAAHGPGASARLAARAACHVALRAPEPWHTIVMDQLGVAGLPLVASEDLPQVTLVVSLGEPTRSFVDLLVREDRVHLLVALMPDRARLGPFVAPGTT